MIIDHIGLRVRDMKKSRAFYDTAMKALGYSALMEYEEGVGYGGDDKKPVFWLGAGNPTSSTHVGLVAESRKGVDAFYAACMKAGAKDNGKPGIRSDYHPHYYGAFVMDPDGNNVEAVCHKPE